MVLIAWAAATIRRHISAIVLVRRDFAITSRLSNNNLDAWKEPPIQRGVGDKVFCVYGLPADWTIEDIRSHLGAEVAAGIKQWIRGTSRKGRPGGTCWIQVESDECYAAALKIPPLVDPTKLSHVNKILIIPSNMAAMQKTVVQERLKAEKSIAKKDVPKK